MSNDIDWDSLTQMDDAELINENDSWDWEAVYDPNSNELIGKRRKRRV